MIDFSRPLQTRDGSIRWDKDGVANTAYSVRDGRPSNLDLINVPEPRVFYGCLGGHGPRCFYFFDTNTPEATHRITIYPDGKCEIEQVKP